MVSHPTAFISYSWDSDEHREWVKTLATRLRSDGIDVTLDQWHAVPGDQLPDFMSSSIEQNDFVLIVCTPSYKEKSKRKVGGVRYEGDIITSQLFITQNQRKFIPVLRQGKWEEAAPIWVVGKYYIDLRTTDHFESSYLDLLRTLRGDRPQAPNVGSLDLTERQFRDDLRKPDYLDAIKPSDISSGYVRAFILDSVNELPLRIRALELFCKWGLSDSEFLELAQQDYQQDFRAALASCIGNYEVNVSEDILAKLLSDEELSVRKAAIEAASAQIRAGHFTSALLQHSSTRKSWESRYAAVRKIIEIDDNDSVKTLLYFKVTDYHRARDRIREYFEMLYQEGRLQGDNLASALELLSKYANDGQSKAPVTKRLLRTLDILQGKPDNLAGKGHE